MTHSSAKTERLDEAIDALSEIGWAIEVADANWCLRWVSEELKLMLSGGDHAVGVGDTMVGSRLGRGITGFVTDDAVRLWLEHHVPYIMWDTGANADALMEGVDERWRPLFERIEPAEPPLAWAGKIEWCPGDGPPRPVPYVAHRVMSPDGGLLGTTYVYGANLRARLLAYVARGSVPMFERMVRLTEPARREAAILFADIQASGALSRKLPSATYFSLLRKLNNTMDDVVIDCLGIVGKHAGDGVTAFFLADDAGGAAGAARAAVDAGIRLRQATAETAVQVAEQNDALDPAGVKLNVGVHWGATLYMGQVATSGRLEVTALGDEVTECARIQETARDGELLVSKGIVERLTDEDAAELGIERESIAYTTLGELPDASEKARRDAGAVAVTRVDGAAGPSAAADGDGDGNDIGDGDAGGDAD